MEVARQVLLGDNVVHQEAIIWIGRIRNILIQDISQTLYRGIGDASLIV